MADNQYPDTFEGIIQAMLDTWGDGSSSTQFIPGYRGVIDCTRYITGSLLPTYRWVASLEGVMQCFSDLFGVGTAIDDNYDKTFEGWIQLIVDLKGTPANVRGKYPATFEGIITTILGTAP